MAKTLLIILALMLSLCGLGLPVSVAADSPDGSSLIVGQAGSSPANAVRMECGKPVGGRLPAGGRTWTVFPAADGQTRGVSMWFAPLALVTADLAFNRTPYFKIGSTPTPPARQYSPKLARAPRGGLVGMLKPGGRQKT